MDYSIDNYTNNRQIDKYIYNAYLPAYMLTYFEAIVLGTIQGITEWLPISSKAMLSLVMIKFFGQSLSEALPIAIWLHIGTVLASIIYFRDELNKIVKRLPIYFSETILGGRSNNKTDFKTKENDVDSMISFLIIATFMTGIIGLPIMLFVVKKAQISGEAATVAIGIFLIVTGFLQRISANKNSTKKLPNKVDAFIVGLGQGFASIPGISRSGTTTGLLLFRKFDSENALRYSYFMSIPAVLSADILLQHMGIVKVDFPLLIGVAFSFIVGLITINILLKVARKMNFSYLCMTIGLLIILFSLEGMI